ncbi:MAG TPA: LLM class flavin-dependent oxidoreductase [Acidimicrobiia bacterium]|jgi:alkanesulfonate monooxygenase SsuD/methylene tetrahydromethanopterin reductase-like flavin-dependent oxidoreductase (luciferase family)
MRVGVVLLPADPWPETVARAQRIDALGYDHLWTYDHLSWRRYRDHEWHATIPWLTGVAAATRSVRIGTMVASPNFRHPVTLAKDAMTIDHVSGGRLELGVGAGGIGFDATVLGGEVLSPRRRVDRLREFVEVLDRLLREPVTSHRGVFYTVDEARMVPGCVQRPRVPLAIAATGPRTLALAARLGDAWITLGDRERPDPTPDETEQAVRAQLHRLEDACASLGRDPTEIRRIYMIDNTGERPIASVAAFEDFVGRYRALGFTDVVFHHPRPDDSVWDDPEEVVEQIATDVLPRLA